MVGSTYLGWALPVLAVGITALATYVVSHRSSQSTFISDIIKEVEFYKGRVHELEQMNKYLNDEVLEIGRENLRLLRDVAKLNRERGESS